MLFNTALSVKLAVKILVNILQHASICPNLHTHNCLD